MNKQRAFVAESSNHHIWRSIGWVLAVVLSGALGLSITSSDSAWAATCPAASGVYNTVYSPDTNGRGVRVANPGMLIEDTSVSCSRVSSLIDHNTSYTRFVEIGWYEMPQAIYYCLPTTSGAPKVIAYQNNMGVRSCWTNPSTVSVGTDSFAVHDDNQDAIWQFFYHGNPVFTGPSMSTFVTGVVLDNGERGNSDNSAKADFNGLLRMNSSMGWVNWTGTFLNTTESDDPGYKGCKYSNIHTAVIVSSGTC